tara:strand:- start:414 stop:878 length:465 start_codon:yes stop_codon:yes gene_type:complete
MKLSARDQKEKDDYDKLEKLRLAYKAKKKASKAAKKALMYSARDRASSATSGKPHDEDYKKIPKLGPNKRKAKGLGDKVVELKMFKGEMIPKKEYDLIMATRKALDIGRNKGGLMKNKSYSKGYKKGGMTVMAISCGASRKPTQKSTPKGSKRK